MDGWHRLSAVSVDKVGVYFRETEPDKKSATGLNAVSCKQMLKIDGTLKNVYIFIYITLIAIYFY